MERVSRLKTKEMRSIQIRILTIAKKIVLPAEDIDRCGAKETEATSVGMLAVFVFFGMCELGRRNIFPFSASPIVSFLTAWFGLRLYWFFRAWCGKKNKTERNAEEEDASQNRC